MEHRSKWFTAFLIFVFGVAVSGEDTIRFRGRINKIDFADQRLIVAGDGFLSSVSTTTFISTRIVDDASKNFSSLATGIGDRFLACYANATIAFCSDCFNEASCQVRLKPLFVARSFSFLTHDESTYFFTSPTEEYRTFISKWTASRNASLSLKPSWTYDVQAVIERKLVNSFFGLAKVGKDGEAEHSIIFKVLLQVRGQDYTQMRLKLDSATDEIVGLIPVNQTQTLYFLTTRNHIGKVTWKTPKEEDLSESHGLIKKATTLKDKWYLRVSDKPNPNVNVKEVKGLLKELSKNEKIVSGFSITTPSRLFLATNQGRYLKFAMDAVTLNFKYMYKATISKNPSGAQVFLKNQKSEFLYGFIRYSSRNSDELFRMEPHDCKRHVTCSSCLSNTTDPDCSWFPIENACLFNNSSGKGKPVSLCPEIQAVLPPAVSIEKRNEVKVKLTQVDPTSIRDKNFLCQWFLPNRQSNTSAKVENDFLICSTPDPDVKDQVREVTDASLQIRMNGNLLTEKKRKVQFYDCRSFRGCALCQKQHSLNGVNFNCTWVQDEKKCGRSQAEIVPAKCAQLKDPGNDLQLRIPSRIPWSLTLQGEQLEELQNANFKCYVNHEAYDLRVLNDTHLSCSSSTAKDFALSSFTTSANLTILSKATNISVGVKDGRPLKVTLYECKHRSCSACLLEEHRGFLCHDSEPSRVCTPGRRQQPLRSPSCGKTPVVTKISPVNGPLEGGTLVSVSGEWLGVTAAQIKGQVELAGVTCKEVNVTKPLNSFVCTTAPTKNEGSGPVKIWAKNAGREFSYKALSAPVNISPCFCFIDYPGSFNVTLPNFRIGNNQSLSAAGVPFLKVTRIRRSDNYSIECPSANVTTCKGKMVVLVDGNEKKSEKDFHFLPAPYLSNGKKFEQLKSIHSGGIKLTFPASNAWTLSSVSLHVSSLGDSNDCNVSKKGVLCWSLPELIGRKNFLGNLTLRTVPFVNFTRGRRLTIQYFPNPEFDNLENQTTVVGGKLYLNAAKNSDLLLGANESDYAVMLNTKKCQKITVSSKFVICNVDVLSTKERQSPVTVKVFVGKFLNYTLGEVRFTEEDIYPYIITAFVFVFLAAISLVGFLCYSRHRDRLQKKDRRELDKRIEDAHFAAANASRNAFVEMQTAMEDMQLLLDTNAELPYRDFEDFVMAVLLPNPAGKAAGLAEFELSSNTDSSEVPPRELVERFKTQLLSEKPFLLTLIRVFDKTTRLADKSVIAAALSIVLADRMEYYYEVLRELFHHIVKSNVEERKADLALLFRKSETLMEKMLSNWLTICLYNHLRNSDTGKKLYIVFKALDMFVHMGPVDALRFRAKNVLSEDVLLSEEVDCCVITVRGSLKEEDWQSDPMELQILSCDTIGQVKVKIIEALFPHRPFSKRPAAEDYVLQWQRNTGSGSDGSNAFFLHIETQLTSSSNKLPVIGDLNARDALIGAHLVLVRLSQAGNMGGSLSSFASETDDSTNLLCRDSFGEQIHLCHGNTTAYTSQTCISKDFCLPHLLKTRHVLHTYIEDLFKSIFNIDIMEPPPPYVEHIFGVIDDAVCQVPQDREMMAHVWKSNSYILRVWVNLLKNPEFLFDVDKSPVINSNLSVIAAALMDACSYNPKPTSSKGLSSTKLVFLRDIEMYRKWVSEFYTKLEAKKTLPSDQEMSRQYHAMRNSCNFSEDIVFRATRFIYMKSRDLSPMILGKIDDSQWFHTQKERNHFKERVENILGSASADTMV